MSTTVGLVRNAILGSYSHQLVLQNHRCPNDASCSHHWDERTRVNTCVNNRYLRCSRVHQFFFRSSKLPPTMKQQLNSQPRTQALGGRGKREPGIHCLCVFPRNLGKSETIVLYPYTVMKRNKQASMIMINIKQYNYTPCLTISSGNRLHQMSMFYLCIVKKLSKSVFNNTIKYSGTPLKVKWQ